MASETYVIRGGVQGRERLRLLSEVMGPATRALLTKVGVPLGAACLDVGSGGGDVSLELARATGPRGSVVGVDLDAVKVDLATSEARQLGVTNVGFEVRDVTDWEPEREFDLVYARFLLTHLTNPAAVLAAMRRHTRRGGSVIVEDIDFRGHFAEPECPALNRYVELYSASVRRRGGDPDIGPRLPGLLRGAGFDDVRVGVVQPVALEGGIKTLTCVTMEGIVEAVLADGLADAGHLEAILSGLRAFARDPGALLGGPRVFQAWARNPG